MTLKILLENFIDLSTFTLYPLNLHLFDLFNFNYHRSNSVNHFMGKIETYSNKSNFYIIQLFDREEGQIRDFDKFMGDFLHILKRKDKYQDSIIVIMSDHGFNREPYVSYGIKAKQTWSLYKVPFAIKTPGTGQSKTYDYKAQSIDVAPTLLAQVLTEKEIDRLQFDGVDVLNKRPTRKHYINLDQTDFMYQLVDNGGDDPELIKTPLNQINSLKE
jgi:phosphoglycerol transferase MdoB-like AlkP superfamily enzyme